MQTEEILSAGIDIGTSTTQLVFSKMLLQNTGGFGKIPQIKVISKEVIYRSQVYFTPLLSRDEIDGKWVDRIIKKEYRKAGIKPADLSTGAVIITGETSRKKNAEDVVEAIADVAGDFVMATAGADLESVLAGKGAGAAELSRKTGKIVANLDIGGGTTNICLFENGIEMSGKAQTGFIFFFWGCAIAWFLYMIPKIHLEYFGGIAMDSLPPFNEIMYIFGLVWWCYTGFETCVSMGAETKYPQYTLPRALKVSVFLVFVCNALFQWLLVENSAAGLQLLCISSC